MAATLVTIGTADEQLVLVVVLSLLVLALAHVEQGCSSIAALSEATLGLGQACSIPTRMSSRCQSGWLTRAAQVKERPAGVEVVKQLDWRTCVCLLAEEAEALELDEELVGVAVLLD